MMWDSIWRPKSHSPTDPVRRDPLSIGIAFLVNIGYSGAISGFGATLVGSFILGALGLGASLASGLLFQQKPTQQSSSDRQVTVRQSIGARVRFYGRVKVGGTLWFLDVANGALYSAITLNEGEIAGIYQIYLNDSLVTLDEFGRVIEAPYSFTDPDTGSYKVARLLFKYGTADQTVHQILDDAFPVITAAYRLRGVANVLAEFQEVPQDQIANVYPQLNPAVFIVMDASKVSRLLYNDYAWSSNAADVIYDYLTAKDGAGFAYGGGYLTSQIHTPSFVNFASLCQELFYLKNGSNIAQYTAHGGYGLNEEMRDVLPRMLASCDAELYLTTDAKIGIRGGKYVEPTLVIDGALGHILNADFRRGQQALAAFNELTVTYVEPNLDYQEVEAQPWIDIDNTALIGRPITARLDLSMVYHHAQARHLAKIHTHKNNPEWIGTIVTNFYGLNAIDEQMVRIKFAPLMIDQNFRITRLRFITNETGITGAEISVSSLSASAYEWDPELEEGTGPADPPDTSTPADLPPPDDIVVTVKERVVSGGTVGLYIEVTWTEPDRTALSQDVQYRPVGGDWLPMSVSDGVGLAESGIVNEGDDYEVQVRTRSPAGASGPWTAPIPVTAEI